MIRLLFGIVTVTIWAILAAIVFTIVIAGAVIAGLVIVLTPPLRRAIEHRSY